MIDGGITMNIKLMIAEDHSMVREGLKQLIELDKDFKVVAEAGDGIEALNKLKKINPDIILLDINMPKMNGLTVMDSLSKDMRAKVLVLTIHNEADYIIKAMNLGCGGYVLKDSDFETLKNAIITVYNGKTYIEPSIVPIYNAGLINQRKSKSKIYLLSKRELQVLKLLAEGRYNREIGEILNISERTVKNHVSNIFKKIGAADRTQAAVFAVKNGIAEM